MFKKLFFCSTVISHKFLIFKLIFSIFSKVEPKWVKQPDDVMDVLTKEILLECVANGYPMPINQWVRLDNDSKLVK